MGNGDIIWDSLKADDRRILHTDIKESWEDSLWSGTEFKVRFEGLRAIIDFASDVIVCADVGVTPFLGEEYLGKVEKSHYLMLKSEYVLAQEFEDYAEKNIDKAVT